MVTYLLKVTLIWAILLAVYELLYRKSAAYTLNRIYLFTALAAGMLLPLAVLQLHVFPAQSNGATALNNGLQNIGAIASPATQAAPSDGPDFYQLFWWVYLAGVAVVAILCIREVALILRKAIYGHFKTINGHRIFSNKHAHAPFSFMGWIFISNPEDYNDQELNYILRHEDAHNSRKHWLDMILMQLVFIVFWFHPLVWRYRYLLKLTHEYEADHIAAESDTYTYGHFLLRQTLLKGTPAIAHSFHFSPIKNRIAMLTSLKKNNKWKYALALPVLLGCTVLFAKSTDNNQRVRVGDVTTYKGHQFFWTKQMIDSTPVMDPTTGETTLAITHSPAIIFKMDRDSVYANENPLITRAQYRANNMSIDEYVLAEFQKVYPTIPDSIQSISITNMVIDEKGKMVYYDMTCSTSKNTYDISLPDSPFAHYGKLIATIIDRSAHWLPAIYQGKNIKVTPQGGFNVYFKPMTIRKMTR